MAGIQSRERSVHGSIGRFVDPRRNFQRTLSVAAAAWDYPRPNPFPEGKAMPRAASSSSMTLSIAPFRISFAASTISRAVSSSSGSAADSRSISASLAGSGASYGPSWHSTARKARTRRRAKAECRTPFRRRSQFQEDLVKLPSARLAGPWPEGLAASRRGLFRPGDNGIRFRFPIAESGAGQPKRR